MTNLWLVWFIRLRRSRKALGDRKGRPYTEDRRPLHHKNLRKLGADNWACLCYNNKTYNFYR